MWEFKYFFYGNDNGVSEPVLSMVTVCESIDFSVDTKVCAPAFPMYQNACGFADK